MTEDTESNTTFSPKDFLKGRRPERFSDSVSMEVGKLDRAVLEHQLSTLNKRNLELAFEDFAKKLCEKTICPNLLEQTGPVAGGDGKVDSQTFPVSKQQKALWYVGLNDNSDEERWAFAVSTQVDWKVKCRKEVRKIKATDRDYKKAFFITNIYAKANQRSELEDSLAKETGIDVRVLDILWILDQIFKNGYEQLAIDTLSIDIDWKREVEVGASDYAKNLRLEELQKNIKDEIDGGAIELHQLDWLLEEAVLSKELEKPLIETQGLFDRAVKASERYGSPYHLFNAHYQYAWASYWWFEDMVIFEENLLKCIELSKKIEQSGQWGEVVSLLGLFTTYHRISEDKDHNDLIPLRSDITKILLEMSSKDERPSNSLMSRLHIELLKLQEFENIDEASEVFSSILLIVKEGNNLVGFSFDEIYHFVTELDGLFNELDSYEELLDYLTEQSSAREGEAKTALLWLRRGASRLESGKPYQAIKLIGKSLSGLSKRETRNQLYLALNFLSEAYKKIGLFWAARANLLNAASLVTNDYWKSGDLKANQVHVYIRLAIVELQLGRINNSLTWWKISLIVNSNIEEDVISKRDLQNFDAFLSQCILNLPIQKLKKFNKLPDLLDQLQLYVSRSMLLHVLGHEDIVEKEYELIIDKDYMDYLKLVRDTNLGSFPPMLKIYDGRYISLNSTVMGCEINVSFPFRSPLVELAETLLSAIEGLFSTFIIDRVMVIESRLDIEITADDEDEISISHEIDDSSSILKMEILCSSFSSNMLNIDGQNKIQDWLYGFVIEVFAHLMRPITPETTIKSMMNDDRAIERSVSFGVCFVGLQNIMGSDAVKDIKYLQDDESLKTYELLRSEQWDVDFQKVIPKEKRLSDLKAGKDDYPEEFFNSEKMTHDDIKIQNLLKPRLWDKTAWRGVGFSMHPDGMPELTLLINDGLVANKIFEYFQSELGNEDKQNRLKISIIRNFNKNSPAHYRVCLSENDTFGGKKSVQMVSRICTMEPSNSENLNRFIEIYEQSEKFFLSYASLKGKKSTTPLFLNERIIILKSEITILNAWEIGTNDVEMMAIYEEDDPIIPEGVVNPPIIELYKKQFGKTLV